MRVGSIRGSRRRVLESLLREIDARPILFTGAGFSAGTRNVRLQQIDAWLYPAGDQLGAFGRALWTVWLRLTE